MFIFVNCVDINWVLNVNKNNNNSLKLFKNYSIKAKQSFECVTN